IRLAQQKAGVSAIAAAGIEDMPATTDVELARRDEPTGQRFMARQETGDQGQGAWQAVVMVPDEFSIVRERTAFGLARFQNCTKTLRVSDFGFRISDFRHR